MSARRGRGRERERESKRKRKRERERERERESKRRDASCIVTSARRPGKALRGRKRMREKPQEKCPGGLPLHRTAHQPTSTLNSTLAVRKLRI